MTLLVDCLACQHGDHKRHVSGSPPVTGRIGGGWQCPCTGDCAERNRIDAELEAETYRQLVDAASEGGRA